MIAVSIPDVPKKLYKQQQQQKNKKILSTLLVDSVSGVKLPWGGKKNN